MEVHITRYPKNVARYSERRIILPQAFFKPDGSAAILSLIRGRSDLLTRLGVFEAYAFYETLHNRSKSKEANRHRRSYIDLFDRSLPRNGPRNPGFDFNTLLKDGYLSYTIQNQLAHKIIDSGILDQYLKDEKGLPLYFSQLSTAVPDLIFLLNSYYAYIYLPISQDFMVYGFHLEWLPSPPRTNPNESEVSSLPSLRISLLYSYLGCSYSMKITEKGVLPSFIRSYKEYNTLLLMTIDFCLEQMENRAFEPALEPFYCSICLEDSVEDADLPIKLTRCGHTFCKPCWLKWKAVRPLCPYCNAPFRKSPRFSLMILCQYMVFSKPWLMRLIMEDRALYKLLLIYSQKPFWSSVSANEFLLSAMAAFSETQAFDQPDYCQLDSLWDYLEPNETVLDVIKAVVKPPLTLRHSGSQGIIFMLDYVFRDLINANNYSFAQESKNPPSFMETMGRLAGVRVDPPEKELTSAYNQWVVMCTRPILLKGEQYRKYMEMLTVRLALSDYVVFRFDTAKFKRFQRAHLSQVSSENAQIKRRKPQRNPRFVKEMEFRALKYTSLVAQKKPLNAQAELFFIDLVLVLGELVEISFLMFQLIKERARQFIDTFQLQTKFRDYSEALLDLQVVKDFVFARDSPEISIDWISDEITNPATLILIRTIFFFFISSFIVYLYVELTRGIGFLRDITTDLTDDFV